MLVWPVSLGSRFAGYTHLVLFVSGPVDPIVMLQREQLGEDSELSMLSEEDQSGRKESAEEKQ